MNRIMIAGTNSGVGKTTISIGIMAALNKRKLRVAPFKVGPDYIDPGFHKYVTGNPSYNLDSYLLNSNDINYLMINSMKNKDIGIIEGVMGLYDGFGITTGTGSSAHLSVITKTPVILVIDGSGISNSSAAVVLGYKLFNENVNIKGVIVNRVSGEHHYKLIKDIIEKKVNISCVGYLPKKNDINLSSRHLGLIPADELNCLDEKVDKLIDIIEECIDLDKLIEISQDVTEFTRDTSNIPDFIEENYDKYKGKKIGIAWDKAFTFYYQSNIDILKKLGAKLIEFSPLTEKKLSSDLDAIYIGGGFPEVFSKDLERNKTFRDSMYDYLMNNGKCFAECGGYMYLSKGIRTLNKKSYEMVGFFPMICEMTVRLQRFGYVELSTEFNEKKYTTKAHEFHHSKIDNLGNDLDYMYDIKKYRDDTLYKQWQCGLHKNNTIAGYPHINFLTNLELMKELL